MVSPSPSHGSVFASPDTDWRSAYENLNPHAQAEVDELHKAIVAYQAAQTGVRDIRIAEQTMKDALEQLDDVQTSSSRLGDESYRVVRAMLHDGLQESETALCTAYRDLGETKRSVEHLTLKVGDKEAGDSKRDGFSIMTLACKLAMDDAASEKIVDPARQITALPCYVSDAFHPSSISYMSLSPTAKQGYVQGICAARTAIEAHEAATLRASSLSIPPSRIRSDAKPPEDDASITTIPIGPRDVQSDLILAEQASREADSLFGECSTDPGVQAFGRFLAGVRVEGSEGAQDLLRPADCVPTVSDDFQDLLACVSRSANSSFWTIPHSA